MNPESVIRDVLGRMESEAPDFPELGRLGDPLVGGADTPPPRPRWTLVVAAATMVAVVAFLMWGTDRLDRDPRVMTTEVMSTSELASALDTAIERLIAAPAIEVVEESMIGDYLSGRTWYVQNRGGDAVIVVQGDVDVRDTGWWNVASQPPGRGERIVIDAFVLLGDIRYQARESFQTWELWSVSDLPTRTMTYSMHLLDVRWRDTLMAGLLVPSSEITRTVSPEGGEVWSVAGEVDGRHFTQRYEIDALGRLVGWVLDSASPRPVLDGIPFDSSRVEFRSRDEPVTIEAPEVGTPLELERLGFPTELLLNG